VPAVVANIRGGSRAVLAEVSEAVAFTAFRSLTGNTRLLALIGAMTLFVAVTTQVRVMVNLARLSTVSLAMTFLFTESAFHNRA
jgi:hypothetical protein